MAHHLAEIESPDYPDERLVVCRNPLVAAERRRKRDDLLEATEQLLAPIKARVDAGTLRGAAEIGLAVGAVANKRKVKKHFELTISDERFEYRRKEEQIAAEAALDGFYVLRTNVPASELAAPEVVRSYKTPPRPSTPSARSRAPSSSCAPSTTGSSSGSGRTPSSACSPTTSSGTYAKPGPSSSSTTSSRPSPPTRSPSRNAPRRPSARPRPSAPPPATPATPSAPCSTSSPSSSATPTASAAARRPSTPSPSPTPPRRARSS